MDTYQQSFSRRYFRQLVALIGALLGAPLVVASIWWIAFSSIEEPTRPPITILMDSAVADAAD